MKKKKMQHDILTEVHSSSSTSYRYRNKLFVDVHSSYNSSMCVTAGTHPDYMEEKKRTLGYILMAIACFLDREKSPPHRIASK